LRQFKKENNDEIIIKLKELIAIKEDEYDKIQFSLFAKDMQQYKNFKLHMPRQSNWNNMNKIIRIMKKIWFLLFLLCLVLLKKQVLKFLKSGSEILKKF